MRQLGMLQITPSTCSYNSDPVFSNRDHLLFSTGLEIGMQRDKERQQQKELFHTCSALSKETAASFHCSHTSLSESMASSYFWFATLSANRLSLWKTQQRIKHAWTWRLPLQGISSDTKIHAVSVYLIGSLVSWCWAQPNAGMNLPPGFHHNFHSRKWTIPWHANWVLLIFFNWDIVDIFNSFRVYNVMIHNVCIYC